MGYIDFDQLDEVFKRIRPDSLVLIFVANDVDGICSCRMLSVLSDPCINCPVFVKSRVYTV
jgi:single-stranded DNA-specific DHH superfamily exonuclease